MAYLCNALALLFSFGGFIGCVSTPLNTSKSEVAQSKAAESQAREPITLVVGGAGVASFALVGFLKRLEEQQVEVDLIVSTGWPSLFALGYGRLKVNDLEWFAMRCTEKEFSRASVLFSNTQNPSEQFSDTIEKTFRDLKLSQTRIPVVLGAVQLMQKTPEIFSQGDWHYPLLASMAVPNSIASIPTIQGEEWTEQVHPIDVEEAVRRGSKKVVALVLYDDFLDQLKGSKPLERYRSVLETKIKAQTAKAQHEIRIRLGKNPKNFSDKPSAIRAGYREAIKFLKETSKR